MKTVTEGRLPDRLDKTPSVEDNSGQVHPRNSVYEENHEKFPDTAVLLCPASGIEHEKTDRKAAADNCGPVDDILRRGVGAIVPPAGGLRIPGQSGQSEDSFTLSITKSNVIPIQHPLREKNMENCPDYPAEHEISPDPGGNCTGRTPNYPGDRDAAPAPRMAEASREDRSRDALRILPVAPRIARAVLERHHYLHSLPGGHADGLRGLR